MNKLLVICGPTATGKTELALGLARIFNGELISADSRQVYQKMDIGTGKDKSLMGGVPIWGIDLVSPDKEFSVGQYEQTTRPLILDIWERGKLPIIVGGTGLYIKALVEGIPTSEIPRNKALRSNYFGKTPDELLIILSQLNPVKAGSLNVSDRKNPRRLIRAIEIATWMFDNPLVKSKKPIGNNTSILTIGLKASREVLKKNISNRTDRMLKQGMLDEVEGLLSGGLTFDNQALNTIGYREWQDYFEKKIALKEVVLQWKAHQEVYAKRQMVWFKKDPKVKWFDISKPNFTDKVENIVRKWYKSK